MDLEKLKFWKKFSDRSSSPRGFRRNRKYGYGYGLMKDYIRVPHLGAADLFLITGLLLVSNAFMVISLFKFYLNMADYSHAVLVPVIAAAAGWKVLREPETTLQVTGDFWGFPILTGGLVIQFVAMWYEIGLVAGGIVSEYFTSVGLVISLWGLFICFFGLRALRMFWFPLLYLAFLVPGLPGPPEIWLKNTLRNIVTAFSAGVLEVLQYDVFVQNNTMEIVGHKMEGLGDRTILLGVADACSGIRSLWAMLAVAPAIAWFLRLRPFLIALFLPLGVFLAMFQNVLRVVATAVLCDFFGMAWASGTRHDAVGGISFFVSSIIMVILARVLEPPPRPRTETYGSYYTYGVYGSYGAAPGYGTAAGAKGAAYHAANDPEANEDDEGELPEDAATQRENFFTRVARVRVGVYLLLALMFLGQLALFQRYAIRNEVQYELTRNRMSLDAFPGEIGPYSRISWGELPEQALRILRPTESYVARYVSPNSQQIYLIINFWKPVIGFNGSSWAFPHSPDVCFREAGWKIERKVEVPEDLVDRDEVMYSRLYANDQSRQMVLYWYNRDEVTKMMNDFIDVDLATSPEEVGEERSGMESGYFDRILHMVRSWSRPQDYSRFQYSIGIYVQQQGTVEDTILLAQNFSRELRQHIGAFGLTPLQKILETRTVEEAGTEASGDPEFSALDN